MIVLFIQDHYLAFHSLPIHQKYVVGEQDALHFPSLMHCFFPGQTMRVLEPSAAVIVNVNRARLAAPSR
jgi:hypothetical protein